MLARSPHDRRIVGRIGLPRAARDEAVRRERVEDEGETEPSRRQGHAAMVAGAGSVVHDGGPRGPCGTPCSGWPCPVDRGCVPHGAPRRSKGELMRRGGDGEPRARSPAAPYRAPPRVSGRRPGGARDAGRHPSRPRLGHPASRTSKAGSGSTRSPSPCIQRMLRPARPSARPALPRDPQIKTPRKAAGSRRRTRRCARSDRPRRRW